LNVAAEYQQGSGSTPTWKATYTYDRWGNRLQSGGTDNFGVNFTPVTSSDIDAATNRFIGTGSTPTTYDTAGNITQDMKFRLSGSLGMKYEYDAHSRQTTAKLSDNTLLQTSTYDSSGQRVQTTAGGVSRQMVYDVFGQIIAEYREGSLERENFYRGGQLIGTQEFIPVQNVAWTNAIGVSVSGNTITKTASTGWSNAGAVSTQSIASGDGFVEFTPTQYAYRMFGLSNGDSDQSYPDIDFALYPDANQALSVYEGGNGIAFVGYYAIGDRLRVAVEGGVVKYRKNGELLYTSSASPTYPLLVDTAIHDSGSTITNIVISGNLTGVSIIGGPISYVLQDVQGSTRAVMNGNQVVTRHDYLPFGEEIGAGTGLRTTSQGYGAGQE
jgi:hypothetical protein